MNKTKTHIVWAVVDKNEKIDLERTSFYHNRDYAQAEMDLRNNSVVEKNQPYKVVKAWLIIKI